MIVVGTVLGLTIFKRLDNSPKPKRVLFWRWSNRNPVDEILKKKKV
jgi:hypothetical protein